MDLTNEDVADILALLDSLPYDELDLQTPRFRLTLRRTPDGWTQSTAVLSAPAPSPTTSLSQRRGSDHVDVTTTLLGAKRGEADGAEGVHRADGTVTTGPDESSEASGAQDESEAGLDGGAEQGAEGRGGVAVRAPLPGTFYRAPRPGAAPFVEVGSRVSEDTVVGIVETMKLMNSVHAGASGTVAEICLGNAEFAAHRATLMRIEVDP
jgi:acetyl-CoA carboxylase biotin carboxyl carrier protein